MKLEDLKLKCECNGEMESITTKWKGIEVRGWKCRKCKEELIHPEDAQKALEIEKARNKKILNVKIRKVGKSNVITVPRTIMELENLKTGQKLEWNIEGKRLILAQRRI